MATLLYKDGIEHRVEADQVQRMLENGYSVTNEETECIDPVSFEEADINDSGVLNPTEIRQAAKLAGIKGWKNTQISKLKEALGYAQN